MKSQNGQDLWVCETLNYKKNGVFVDIGAYDGMDFSNTYYLEKELGWNGVCVEADKVAFKSLILNRTCKSMNKAIDKESGFVGFNECGMFGCIDKYSTNIIAAITMRQLMEYMPLYIDYISLDIEGNEANALSTFPFDIVKVHLWTIEHNLYKGSDTLKRQIMDIMLGNGYKIAVENVGGDLPFEDWWIKK